jgi:DNA-binding winged helix-turn-helix (wHTH) protein
MPEYPLRPLSYRAELLSQVMPALKAGECCSLIGVSGVGKSNLVRFLARSDVQVAYWNTDTIWLVLIDTHSLVFSDQPAEFVILELIIHRLIMEAERRTMPAEFVSWANDLHSRLIMQPNSHLALRYLERLCARLCEAYEYKIIFVFDQFEDIWQTVDARFFLNLRGLRDQFIYSVAYLVITRQLLQDTRGDRQAAEAFWELFASHTYGLGMYSQADAQLMLERLAERRTLAVDPALYEVTAQAAGRHPGTMRALFWELAQKAAVEPDLQAMLGFPAVAEECAKIWNDLTPDEQHVLRVLAAGEPLPRSTDPAILRDLQLKEIVSGEPPRLFSPLFQRYIAQDGGVDMAGIVVAPQLRQVWRDGQVLARSLTPLEFKLLAYLARNAGSVCPRDTILRELYGEQEYEANDERLDNLLRRLRDALGEDVRNPRYLITHRGAGVQLTRGRVQE